MNRFSNMKRQMKPSDAAMNELYAKIEAEQPAVKSSFMLKRALPMAACLLLVIGGVLGYFKIMDGYTVSIEYPTTSAQSDGKLTGLPIQHQLPERITDGPQIAADRLAFFSLEDFFYQADVRAFALAQVTETQLLPPQYDHQSGRLQSTLEVIEWVYGQETRNSFTLTQPLYGENILLSCVGEPILLREGGVYLLPLTEYEGQYYPIGDEDVLFELDERGNIFSHSSFEEFAAFDGQPYEELVEAMRKIVRGNPLLVQYQRFARILRDEVPLAVITILDDGRPGSAGGSPYLSQRARTELILRQGSGQKWQVVLPEGEFTINTMQGFEAQAEKGGRYLVFVYGNEYEFSFEANRAARINDDGTITPLTEWNSFSELAGMTVEQLQALMN
ncbi:MAG: hypothetical protein FWH26_10855 [Oscillospiraceae bacterium]|nr:hypothetical protein [Oscillospiraceae bacterium]